MAGRHDRPSTSNDMILNFHDAVLYRSDLDLLRNPTAWLNDAVVHFHFTWLSQNYPDRSLKFIDPAVATYLVHQCHDDEDIRDFVNGFDLPQETRKILIPINDAMIEDSDRWLSPGGGSHWSLLVIVVSQMDKATSWHFDSIEGSGNAQAANDVTRKLANLFPNQCLRPIHEARTPKQRNGYDCGMHVLVNSEHIAMIPAEASLEVHEKELFKIAMHNPNIFSEQRTVICRRILDLAS